MIDDDVVGQLTAASPRHLLEDLARIGAALAKHDRMRPEVEVFLASGQIVRGRIVSVGEHRDGVTALVQIPSEARRGQEIPSEARRGQEISNPKAPAVAFVRVDQIAAITVVDASVLVKAPTSDLPVPSKLELMRQAVSRGEGLAGTLGRSIAITLGGATELDDDGRRAIGVAMPLVVDVIGAIAGDAMGREALAKIESIELGSATTGEVRIDGRRLVIRAPKLLSEQLTHQTLRKSIEKLL